MSDDKVKLLADAIWLELLAELRVAKDADTVAGIQQRADTLNQLDNRDFRRDFAVGTGDGGRAESGVCAACLRFRDDGRDWSGEILLETSDGEVKRAVSGSGRRDRADRLDGVERMTEFSRFTGECIDAAYMGKLRIASSELYRVHPETYRVREQAWVGRGRTGCGDGVGLRGGDRCTGLWCRRRKRLTRESGGDVVWQRCRDLGGRGGEAREPGLDGHHRACLCRC